MEPSNRSPKWVHPTWARRPVWTVRRKVMGNFIPGLLALPLLGWGLFIMWRSGIVLGWGLAWLGASVAVGWLAVNFFGLYQNRAMRKEMEMRLRSENPNPPYRRYFAGMATPAFRGVLDPHEDVGFLMLHSDRVEFFGERIRVSIDRSEVREVRIRPNVHTLIGLGRWVSIEAEVDGKPARLMVELRQRPTLFGNLLMSRTLLRKLKRWFASTL